MEVEGRHYLYSSRISIFSRFSNQTHLGVARPRHMEIVLLSN